MTFKLDLNPIYFYFYCMTVPQHMINDVNTLQDATSYDSDIVTFQINTIN